MHQKTLALARDIVKASIYPLFRLWLVCAFFSMMGEDYLASLTDGRDAWRLTVQVILIMISLVEEVGLILIFTFGLTRARQLGRSDLEPNPFTKGYFASFLAEYLRVLAQTLLWSLFLLIPGLVRYTRLIFVRFIAIIYRPYRNNQVDALKLSIELTRPIFWRLFIFIAIMSTIQVALEFAPHLNPVFHLLPLRLLFHMLSYAVSAIAYAYLYEQFIEALKKAR